MKKLLALTFSLVLAASMLTACGKANNNSSSENTTETTTATEMTTEDTTAESGEGTVSTIFDDFAKAADEAVEWPMMEVVTDADRIKEYFTLDVNNENYEDVYVKNSMMSAAFGEYIIIKAKDGKVDEAVKDLEARKEKMIETDAFYPNDKEIAQNAIVGKEGNYAYLIAHENAKDVEAALKEALAK